MYASNILLSFAVIIFASAAMLPTIKLPSSEEVSTFIGPQLWPMMLLIILLMLSLLLCLSSLKSFFKIKNLPFKEFLGSVKETRKNKFEIQGLYRFKHWGLMICIVTYTILLPTLGLIISTLLFTLVSSILLGSRSIKNILISLVISVLVMKGVFVHLLGVPIG